MNRSRTSRLVGLGAAVLLTLPLAACGSEDDGGTGSDAAADTSTSAKAEPTSTLTVFAAASLTKTFTELEKVFEKANPGVDVKLSFGGSSDLVAQISEGAAADVFASADDKNMAKLAESDLVDGEPVEFATNTLTIVTPSGNPGDVTGLADLGDEAKSVVVCAPEVPCGAAALKVAELAGVALKPDSEEQSVTDVLAKVQSGEADAGLVYVTDAAGDSKVDAIEFPESKQVVNNYPIAAVDGAENGDLAKKWIALVTGDEGQKVLQDAGFGPPPA